MLAIRMQRTGRKKHAMFRVVVQESRLQPTSGRFVARLGSYDPHTKALTLDKEQAEAYLKNGAQPSDRVVVLLQQEGVKLPSWVKVPAPKSGQLRNPEKLRKNQPAQAEPSTEEAPEAAESPAEEPKISEEEKPEAKTEDKSTEAEKPADTKAEEPAKK